MRRRALPTHAGRDLASRFPRLDRFVGFCRFSYFPAQKYSVGSSRTLAQK
jgi:hypothetical protein